MSTKDAVAQQVLTNEALYRISPMLDQITDGLKHCTILKMLRALPEVCLPLLTYNGVLSAEDVLHALCVDDTSVDEVAFKFLQRFITEADETSKYMYIVERFRSM